MTDSTTFRENVLLVAVDFAEENGWGQYHPFEAVIARGGSDPTKTRNALAHWCNYRREGAKDPVLLAYGGDPLNGSYAVNHESRRMVDVIRRERRRAGTHIAQVNGPVHTGSGDLNVQTPPAVAADSNAPVAGAVTSATIWAREIARRILDHREAAFQRGDVQAIEAGPMMVIFTGVRRYGGNVIFVRSDERTERFIPDPDARDCVQVRTLDGKIDHVPVADIKGVQDVACRPPSRGRGAR